MAIRSTGQTWGSVARGLHWISAALILFGLTHGTWMANFLEPRNLRLSHYVWHAAIFMYFGLLLALRIVWRLSDQRPEEPRDSTSLERNAASAAHLALYSLMIAMLVSGYMIWSSFPARFDPARAALVDIRLFGVFKLPALHTSLNRDVFKFWEHTHTYLAWSMMALVAVHVLAALRHHFIKGNDVLWRMMSGKSAEARRPGAGKSGA